MRLIDADALMQTLGITDTDCHKCAWADKPRTICKRGSDFEDACIAIENAPTIEERKTGTQKTFSEMVHLHDSETHIPYPDQIIDIVSEVPLVQPIDGQGIKECMARLKKVKEEERNEN